MSPAVPGCHRLSLSRQAHGNRQQGVGQSKGQFPKVARGSKVGPLGTSLLAGGSEGTWGLLLGGVPPGVKEDPEGNTRQRVAQVSGTQKSRRSWKKGPCPGI